MRAALFIALTALLCWLGPYAAVRQVEFFDELFEDEIAASNFYRMVDEDGRTIVITGRRLRVKDRYLAADNRLYEVIEVDGYLARARFIKEERLSIPGDAAAYSAGSLQVQGSPARLIAIYHSHNAESYVPSDGTDSIYGRGGIHDVGVAFREALEELGIDVIHSERLHLPHDRGAYRRSRVTAQELLRQRPDAIFDVHRDAAPWEAYALELDGEWISQIHFVVGLSNPGSGANQRYAFDLKAHADHIHPGLVRGVFLIWGGYNQDLSPVNVLLEVGAHTNTKESAIRGITLFADVVTFYFYGEGPGADGAAIEDPGADDLPPALYRDAGGIIRAVSGTVLGLLLTSLGAALGFYFLNTPEALEKIIRWWEHFPEWAVKLAKITPGYLVSLPERLRLWAAGVPDNLRESWFQFREDAVEFPGLLAAFLGAMAGSVRRKTGDATAAGRMLWKKVPANLRHSWNTLIQEGRAFPAAISRLLMRARRAAARMQRTAASIAGEAGSRLARSARTARAEAEDLFLLLRRRLK